MNQKMLVMLLNEHEKGESTHVRSSKEKEEEQIE